ncbi:MAG: hypothetical protein HW387_766 [Parachlamydiales bacterium]|nr:hypothetical protein [Parachlamydiales bacterium]
MNNSLKTEESPIQTELPKIEFLHQLLPYDPSTKRAKALQTGLKEYQFLLNAALEAIHHFEMGDLERFDSLVGENACQIRAVMLALIASKKTVNVCHFRQRILKALVALKEYLEPKKIAALMLSLASLSEVIRNEKLIVSLTAEEIFLIQSFLLTESKVSPADSNIAVTIRNVTCPNKLKKISDVSSNFTTNLVKKMRKLLSLASVHFVRETAKVYHDLLTQKMVSDEFTNRHINCACIPMFWAYKSLLNRMLEEKIPVIIHAKVLKKEEGGQYSIAREISLYNGNDKTDQFIEMPASKIENDQPSIVLEGIILNETLTEEEWMRSMELYSVSDIILAAAADHRQYPDPELDQLINTLDNKEFQFYKNQAEQNGFSLKNPFRFFIQHVYTAKPKTLSFLHVSDLFKIA